MNAAMNRLLLLTLAALTLALTGCSDNLPGINETDEGVSVSAAYAFGETYTFTDGVQVTVDAPNRVTQQPNMVRVTFTVTNGTGLPLTKGEDLAFLFHAAVDVNGSPAAFQISPNINSRGFPTVILPGEHGTSDGIYRAATGSTVTATWKRGNGELAIFTGQA